MQLHTKDNIITKGVALEEAEMVLVMLHGRGASANDIVELSTYFALHNAHIIAPEATNNSWYPFSFLVPVEQNEPWLSSSLDMLKKVLDDVLNAGKQSNQIFILGFSQGACLTLEFAARNATQFGGVVAFTGGLIGNTINNNLYKGDFNKTKIFIGNSDKDPHVPLQRSKDSQQILQQLGADVSLKIYPNMPHTIIEDEINWVNENLFG